MPYLCYCLLLVLHEFNEYFLDETWTVARSQPVSPFIALTLPKFVRENSMLGKDSFHVIVCRDSMYARALHSHFIVYFSFQKEGRYVTSVDVISCIL